LAAPVVTGLMNSMAGILRGTATIEAAGRDDVTPAAVRSFSWRARPLVSVRFRNSAWRRSRQLVIAYLSA